MQRTIELLLSLIGAVAVLTILVFNRRGMPRGNHAPAWWRRLLAGGLTLLGLMGFLETPARAGDWVKNPHVDSGKGADSHESAEMKEFIQICKEAEDVAYGMKGDYPFDAAGKTRLLESLGKARELVGKMVAQNIIRSPEAELLKADLIHLTQGVNEKRPKEMEMATCYKPRMFTPVKDSYERLLQRLPHLEKLAGGKVSPAVMEKVIGRMEADLKLLSTADSDRSMSDAERAKAEQLAKTVGERLEEVRRLLEAEKQ